LLLIAAGVGFAGMKKILRADGEEEMYVHHFCKTAWPAGIDKYLTAATNPATIVAKNCSREIISTKSVTNSGTE
jgi:hypothetical protein